MRTGRTTFRLWAGMTACIMLGGGCATPSKSPAPPQNHVAIEAFIQAAGSGDLPAVSSALQQGINVNAKDANGTTAIQKASRYNKHQMVDYLIKNGADVTLADRQGFDALLMASSFGQDDVIRILVANKVELNTLNDKGLFPLLLAVDGDYAATVRLLLHSGARPNLTNTNGTSALMYACAKNSKDAVTALLELGADPNLPDKEGFTPLMVAVQQEQASVIDELIRHGANINLENKIGMNALLLAIECDHLDLARLLIKNNARGTTSERYPYLAGVSCYLGAKHLNGSGTAGELKTLYASAARLFDTAAKEYEAAIQGKKNNIVGRNLRSALFIGGSALLLVATGGMPMPCALTNERLHDEIKTNKTRLSRCNEMKAQCESAIARLSPMDANSRPDQFSLEDLTLTFKDK